MLTDPGAKYAPFPPIALPDRQWPGRIIAQAPRWLSTDLRDGNQAIVDPMDSAKKTRFFDLLVEVGFKEIEVGFPSAGQTEFDFIAGLVQSGRIPDDVVVQVLTQSREDLIRTSFARPRRRARGDRPPLQRGQPRLARDRVRDEPRRGEGHRGGGREGDARRGRQAARDRVAFSVQPRNLLHRRTRFQPRGMCRIDGHPRAHARTPDYPQPARHGRGGNAQYLRRPDRVFHPQPARPARAR